MWHATRRYLAFVLLLAFAGGNLGLPVLDAFAFHRAGAERLGVHFESQGIECHGERCALGVGLAAPRQAVPAPVSRRIAESPVRRIQVSSFRPIRELTAARLPSSRAPPLPV